MIRPLSRRTVLRGLGAAVALPFLDAMRPAARATAPPETLKLVVFFVPNGAPPSRWIPPDVGAGWTASPILRGLDGVRDHVLVLSHLANAPAVQPDGEQHTYCTGTCLTSVRAGAVGSGQVPRNGVSLDQQLAAFQASGRPFPSLELGSEAPGVCNLAWCAGAQNVSWSGPTTPRPPETRPSAVFQRLFGVQAGDGDDWVRRQVRRQSILDAVRDDAARVEARLGHQDRTRLDEYLTSVREIEARLQSATLPSCTTAAWPTSAADTPSHVRQMGELAALALECGQTDIVTYMLGIARSNRPYPFLGIPESHHELTHASQPDAADKVERIVRWEVEQYAWLVDRLARVPSASGTLLDEAAVLFLSGMGDPEAHSAVDLPVLLAGRGNGAFAPGRHVAYPAGTPLARLHLSILGAAGAPATSFGMDGREPLTDLG